MMARFRNFYNVKKSQDFNSLKRRSAFRTGAKIYLSKQNILGLWAHCQAFSASKEQFKENVH